MNHNNELPKASVAFPMDGKLRVWLAGGLVCPRCGSPLAAHDVAVDGFDITFICSGTDCHSDILTIRSDW
jgi:hypothetical protein